MNRKLSKLINITCSVPSRNTSVLGGFGDSEEEMKSKAVEAMIKALELLSSNTMYESEIKELIDRCSYILDID